MAIKRKESILVVEDSPDVALVLREMLIRRGYHANVAGTAKDALAILAVEPPDLILLEVGLHKSGYASCRKLKSKPATRHIPIVMLTGLLGREDLLRAPQQRRR